jgi:hypothetical protein
MAVGPSPDNPLRGSCLCGLDGDAGIRPEFHLFVGSRAPWEQLPDDGLRRYDEAYED